VALPTTASSRIKGNGLVFQINNGTTDKDFSYDCISVMLKSEDASNDQTTFYDSAQGGAVDLFFEVDLIQSTESTSLWALLESKAGQELTFKFAPYAVTTTIATHPTATLTTANPGYTGTLRIPRAFAAGLGGQASPDGTWQAETVRFDIVGTTTKATTGTWVRDN